MGQKQHIEAKILKIGLHLGMALCDQSFTVYRINVHYIEIDQNDKLQIFWIFYNKLFCHLLDPKSSWKMGSFEAHNIIAAQKISKQERGPIWQKWVKMSKNGNINTSPTHIFFKIQNHNGPRKRELFMKILGIENEKLVYSEKFEKKWNLPFWPILI